MTTPSTNDKTPDQDPAGEGGHPPGSGHGADSALDALIRRRVPPPEPPLLQDEAPV